MNDLLPRTARDRLATLSVWIERAEAAGDLAAAAKLRAIAARWEAKTGDRPAPGWEATPGHHFEAAEEDDRWRAVDPEAEPRRCRDMNVHAGYRCPHMATAKLLRKGRKRSTWWYYCGSHMYGRWIESGKVMGWKLVPDTRGGPDA